MSERRGKVIHSRIETVPKSKVGERRGERINFLAKKVPKSEVSYRIRQRIYFFVKILPKSKVGESIRERNITIKMASKSEVSEWGTEVSLLFIILNE